eukprot:CAMPEP_0181359728 /NCGR_PEP_ID=MMETSP1106-20121128/6255_1 /TAXON_ID=81844 /ORGANISM="Mantoniella antarctica, Strain SL-175" /LENGTH=177 /DNA_ID=CAMNT_0023472889 /DNA_START=365 /DNA_END=899 /DNA_ORIENTATION=-
MSSRDRDWQPPCTAEHTPVRVIQLLPMYTLVPFQLPVPVPVLLLVPILPPLRFCSRTGSRSRTRSCSRSMPPPLLTGWRVLSWRPPSNEISSPLLLSANDSPQSSPPPPPVALHMQISHLRQLFFENHAELLGTLAHAVGGARLVVHVRVAKHGPAVRSELVGGGDAAFQQRSLDGL